MSRNEFMFCTAGIALAFAVMLGVGTADAESAQAVHDEWCEMIAIWEADKARGVPEHLRDGWPSDGRVCK